MKWCLVSLVLVSLALHEASGQLVTTGFCRTSSYQTSYNFSTDYIKKMVEAPQGHVLLLSNTGPERCQKLNFTSNNTFTYSYFSREDELVETSNYFTTTPWGLSTPASLNLGIYAGLLSETPLLHQNLFPVIARDDMVVFLSCEQRLVVTTKEEVRVYVPLPYTGSPSIKEVKDLLRSLKLPQFSNLSESNRNCSASMNAIHSTTANRPLTIFETIAGALTNPASIIPSRPPSVLPSNPSTIIDTLNSITGAGGERTSSVVSGLDGPAEDEGSQGEVDAAAVEAEVATETPDVTDIPRENKLENEIIEQKPQKKEEVNKKEKIDRMKVKLSKVISDSNKKAQ